MTTTPSREDRYYAAMQRGLEAVIRLADEERATTWDEGYEAGYQMARSWGHVDYWENEPANPYELRQP